MRRMGDALRDMVKDNPLLQLGLQHRLFNLRKTAAYLRPLIEARVRKAVTVGSLTMALSRLQKREEKTGLQRTTYRFNRVALRTGLVTCTFGKSREAHAGVQRLYAAVHARGGYMTVAEGTGQITIIVDAEHAGKVRQIVGQKPQYQHDHVASVSVAFDERYLDIPGLIYIVLQQLMFLNINIIEVSSTYTELSIYVREEDVKLAFEALESLFHGQQ